MVGKIPEMKEVTASRVDAGNDMPHVIMDAGTLLIFLRSLLHRQQQLTSLLPRHVHYASSCQMHKLP